MHPHSNMEIFSYIVAGAISHTDTMGNSKTLKPGEVQLMSTGSGIRHSEFNPSDYEELHLLQIWLAPNKQGITPSYTEWKPTEAQKNATKTLIISPDGKNGSATIHQDASIYRIKLNSKEQTTHELSTGRGMWIQIIKGSVMLNDTLLETGDAASTETANIYTLNANSETELLLFDLG